MLIHEKLTTRLNDDLTAQSSRDNAITTKSYKNDPNITKLNNLFFLFFFKSIRKDWAEENGGYFCRYEGGPCYDSS